MWRNRRHRISGTGGAFQSESHCFYWHNGRPRPSRRTPLYEGGRRASRVPGQTAEIIHKASYTGRPPNEASVMSCKARCGTLWHSDTEAEVRPRTPERSLGAAPPAEWLLLQIAQELLAKTSGPPPDGSYDITNNQSTRSPASQFLRFREAGLTRVVPHAAANIWRKGFSVFWVSESIGAIQGQSSVSGDMVSVAVYLQRLPTRGERSGTWF